MNVVRVSVIWPSSLSSAEVAGISTRTIEEVRDVGAELAKAVEMECCWSVEPKAVERHTILLVVEVEASREGKIGFFGGLTR